MSAWASQNPVGYEFAASIGDYTITDTTKGTVLASGNMGTFSCAPSDSQTMQCTPTPTAVATSEPFADQGPDPMRVADAGDDVKIVLTGSDLSYPANPPDQAMAAFPTAYHLSSMLAWE